MRAHIWGIEFLLNMTVMFAVSHFYPVKEIFVIKNYDYVDDKPWKYAKTLGSVLAVLTILIYVLLGQ